jgi:hypothetical protein
MPPTMFDSPWPRNSRLASRCCPERDATALAIEIDCPSATIVSAKGDADEVGQQPQVERRQREARPDRRQRADDRDVAAVGETALDREREQGREREREQHVRRALELVLQQDGCDDGEDADEERRRRDAAELRPQVLGEVAEPVRRRRRQAEQVGQRVERDQRGGAGHEAAQRRRRDEVRDRAEPERPDRELHRADEDGDGERERDVVRRADHGERRERREERERVRVGRPRDDVPARAEQRRDDAGDDRGREAVLGRQAGERRERDRLRQDEQRTEQAGDAVGAHDGAINPTDPRPEDARSELVHRRRLSARICADAARAYRAPPLALAT